MKKISKKVFDKVCAKAIKLVNTQAEEQKKRFQDLKNMKVLFDKVFNCLLSEGSLDDEDIAYNLKDYSITQEEFLEIHDFLASLVPTLWSDPKYDYTQMFEEKMVFFEYNKHKFIWRCLSGQGTASQLILAAGSTIKFEEDKKITISLYENKL